MRPGDKMEHACSTAQKTCRRVFRARFQTNHHRPARRGAHRLPFDVQNGPVDRSDVWGDADFGRYPARARCARPPMRRARASYCCEMQRIPSLSAAAAL